MGRVITQLYYNDNNDDDRDVDGEMKMADDGDKNVDEIIVWYVSLCSAAIYNIITKRQVPPIFFSPLLLLSPHPYQPLRLHFHSASFSPFTLAVSFIFLINELIVLQPFACHLWMYKDNLIRPKSICCRCWRWQLCEINLLC